jgi:hypothetical protein
MGEAFRFRALLNVYGNGPYLLFLHNSILKRYVQLFQHNFIGKIEQWLV